MRRTLLAITAVLLATVGTTLLYVYVTSADDRARAEISTVKVLVAQQDAPLGTPAGDLRVQLKEIPGFGVVPGALASMAEVRGKVLNTRLFVGQQLSARMFDARTASGVPLNHRAVSVSIQAANRVPGMVKADSQVDVFVANGKLILPVLTNAHVLSVDNQGIVTFDLEEAQAQTLIKASVSGQLILMAIS